MNADFSTCAGRKSSKKYLSLFAVFGWFLLCAGEAGSAAAAGVPSADAGPAKVIAFPAQDLTLFGHASDADGDAMTYAWSQVAGPAAARLSAPWALATTVTFSQTGTYSFRLSVSDGTNTVTSDTAVTVLSPESQTAFYVDPTYSGGSSDGSASRPWKSLAGLATSTQWTAVNAALSANNVIIYFSVRTAGGDVAEVERSEVNLWRMDGTSHRLTLDGMSKYNTNDAAPVWAAYGGPNQFHIAVTSGALSIGVQNSNTSYPMHYTTIRGFDLSGASGRALIAGNFTVFEYNRVHDVTTTGATVQFQPAVHDYPTCTVLFGNLHDITFRGNVIERGEGESLYIAGTYTRQGDGGCLAWGNTHSDILLEGNTIGEAGTNGGEHDGIDLKAGLTNVTVRNNLITNRPSGTKGIGALGVFYTPGTCCIGNYLIEGNTFRGGSGIAIVLQKQNGAVVRNNVSYGGGGMQTSGDTNTAYWTSQNVAFYNNTLYGNTEGISTSYANNVLVKNNLIFGNGVGASIQGNSTATNVIEDYNLYDVPAAQVTNGGHSVLINTSTGLVLDAAAGNFRLPAGSLAIDKGVNLTATGFATDVSGAMRQQGTAWDIGAYAFAALSALQPATNVRIIR